MTIATQVGEISDRERRITLIALLVVFLLAALDQSIISTAMPRIIEDLNGLEFYAWVTTAYLLTSTVLVPIYGRLGDMYGRKRILIVGISLFLSGSLLCGMSGEFGSLPLLGDGMHQLIIFRGLQGVGGAALFTSAIAIIAELYPPRERARFLGVFSAIFGLASIVGPAVGGLLTDHATTDLLGYHIAGWRWVFYVNMPLGMFAMFMIIAKTPAFSRGTGGKIDFLGAALIIIAFVPFLLALTWGGRTYPWDSLTIISMFVSTVISLCLFVWLENSIAHPILPMGLFKIPGFYITNLATFTLNMSFFGIVIFMPLYMQVVQGVSATNSGITMFPLMIGMMTSSITSGRLVSHYGHYKPFLIGGNIIFMIGIVFFTQINADTSSLDLAWRMVIVGLGLGPTMSLTNMIVQSAVQPQQIGVATSSTQFFRQIGSTIGVALFGTFLIHNLNVELPKQLPADIPGMNIENLDLSQAQANARNPDSAKETIKKEFDKVFAKIEATYHGDAEARQTLIDNPALPAILKNSLPDKTTLAAMTPEQVDQRLATLRKAFDGQVDQFTERMSRGMKVAFSNSITGMYGMALTLVIVGFLISCFIPVLPLHSHAPMQPSKKNDAVPESVSKKPA